MAYCATPTTSPLHSGRRIPVLPADAREDRFMMLDWIVAVGQQARWSWPSGPVRDLERTGFTVGGFESRGQAGDLGAELPRLRSWAVSSLFVLSRRWLAWLSALPRGWLLELFDRGDESVVRVATRPEQHHERSRPTPRQQQAVERRPILLGLLPESSGRGTPQAAHKMAFRPEPWGAFPPPP